MDATQVTYKYHTPVFEHKEVESAWLGHRSFAYDYIRNSRPRLIVELGTHLGASFFAMCQAVKDGGLTSRLVSVDNWCGDPFVGEYGPDVKAGVESTLGEHYPRVDYTLVQDSFEGASALFDPGSIDLLHIDGSHRYQDVKADFERWLPLVADDGLVMLHDVSVTRPPFGVYRLWYELTDLFPTMTFGHCCGLGLLKKSGRFEQGQEWLERYGAGV